jgi:hypothetical protein
MHVPLNDTLQVVKEIPGAQVEAALDEVLAQLQQTHKRVKLQDAMKPLADKLQADLVVCPVLNNYEQWTEMSWGWNIHSCCTAMWRWRLPAMIAAGMKHSIARPAVTLMMSIRLPGWLRICQSNASMS